MVWISGALGGTRVVRRDVFGGEVAGRIGPEEFQHARPHGGLVVIVAKCVGDIGHNVRKHDPSSLRNGESPPDGREVAGDELLDVRQIRGNVGTLV